MAKMVGEEFPGINVTPQRVQQIRNEEKIIWRPAKKIPLLTGQQKDVRVLAFTEYKRRLKLADGDPQKIQVILFTDESRLSTEPDCDYVRYARGEWNETACKRCVKYPPGIMVWGMIGPGGFRKLVRCPRKIDWKEYLRILDEAGFINELNERYGEGNWMFEQDGAPCHTAASTMARLQEMVPLLEGWPPQSPDASPIEMMWSIIKAEIAKVDWAPLESHVKQAQDKLWEVAESTWDAVPNETIDRLCSSFEHRCDMIVQVGGNSIAKLLSSHMEPRPQDCREATVAKFSDEDDSIILAMGRAKRFAKLFKDERWRDRPECDKRMLKWRFRYLDQMEKN